MKITKFGTFFIACALVAALPKVYGQEYFSTIASPDQLTPVTPVNATPEASPDQVPADRVDMGNLGEAPSNGTGADKYNMALGDVHFSLAAGIGLEYNDNINLAPSGQKISDFAVRPSATIDATYAFSEMNTLRFSLGASYAAYFNHSEFDTRGVLLSPNSILAYTMHVGPVVITLRDRFSYQEDPFENALLSGVATYRRFENQVGIQADWAVNQNLTITGGYDHYNLWALDTAYENLTHSVDTIYIKPGYQIMPAVRVGVNANVSFINYDKDIQNGGTGFMAGPFAEIAASSNTHIYVEGGYQGINFNDNGLIADNSNVSTWYARVDIANRLSENFTQRLSFTKSAELGDGSNYYDLYHVEYAADWKIMQNLTLDPSLFYEHYKTSEPVGFTGETADRYGAAIGLRYVLTPSITLGLDYRYIYKNSNLSNLDYRQNLVLLSAYYNF